MSRMTNVKETSALDLTVDEKQWNEYYIFSVCVCIIILTENVCFPAAWNVVCINIAFILKAYDFLPF